MKSYGKQVHSSTYSQYAADSLPRKLRNLDLRVLRCGNCLNMGQAESAFEKGIHEALGGDATLYAFPDEPFYDQAHVKRYNFDVKTTPLAVTYPKTAEQVSKIVKLAQKYDLKVQAKCGGHSFANFCDPNDGIIIDLKHFQKFEIDTTTWRCVVGGGTLLGELTKRMYEPHRRAMAHGTCPAVGIGGHATIGGLGPSSRLWGSALDHIEEVEIIVANGDIIRANKDVNSDIFWAVRGAGGSFGVITEFVVKTEAAPEKAVQYSYSFTGKDPKDMAKTLKAWQDYVSDPELTRSFASTATITEAGLTIAATYYGTDEEFNKLQIKKHFPGNQSDKTIVFDDYLGLVGHWFETWTLEVISDKPAHSYAKTLTFDKLDRIPDTSIDKLCDYISTADKGTPLWFVIFDLAGGAVNDVAADATAYAHRDALFYLQSYVVNLTGDVNDASKDFLKTVNKTIKDGMVEAGETKDTGAYPGYVDLELGAGAQQAYWGANLPRLEEIKQAWDHRDVFHNPQSVRPGGREVASHPKIVFKKQSLLRRLTKRFKRFEEVA